MQQDQPVLTMSEVLLCRWKGGPGSRTRSWPEGAGAAGCDFPIAEQWEKGRRRPILCRRPEILIKLWSCSVTKCGGRSFQVRRA
jgi:hypothetical protein